MANVRVKIQELNRINKNNRRYSNECIRDLYDRYKDMVLPVKMLTRATDTNYAPILGTATITDFEYPSMTIDCDISDGLTLSMIEKDIGGFGFVCEIDPDSLILDSLEGDDFGIKKIEKLNYIGYTINPSQVSTMEIIKDDI